MMKLISETDPMLKQPLEDFDFSNPPIDPVQLATDLAEVMLSAKGVGLSANQVGMPYRVFVMATSPQITACFNPRIVDRSSDSVMMVEGCLSYPGLAVKIARPSALKVRFTMPNGETVTQKYTGLTARIFQHELDHMDGIVYLDRAKPLAKQIAMKKWSKLRKVRDLKNKLGYN